MSNPNSPDEWMNLARSHEAQARACARGNGLARQGVLMHVGMATEAALKAAIMKKERLNRWPDQDAPGNYWTHDLNKLREKAGLKLSHSDAVAPKWMVVVQWDRHQDYNPKPTPGTVAHDYLQAAFGLDGVIPWIVDQL